jgi:hypothetical protein
MFSRGYSNFSDIEIKQFDSEIYNYVSETADESQSLSVSDSEDVNSPPKECTAIYDDYIL